MALQQNEWVILSRSYRFNIWLRVCHATLDAASGAGISSMYNKENR